MSYIGNPINSVAFLTDQFSGNGSTTAFTMSVAPANTASLIVAVSGVLQDPSTYSVVGTTLTFSAAPPSGTGNISVRYLGIPAAGVTTTAYRTVTDSTATAGQTTFSVPSYTVGYINVYQNGVRLGAADFTATNGTTVVLAVGAAAGDLITTESFYVSSVLNAIANTNGSVTQLNLAPNVAGNGPAFSAYRTGTQTGVSSSTPTKVQINTKTFDTNNNYDTSTYRFTPTVAGYYQVNGSIVATGTNITYAILHIYKNSVGVLAGPYTSASTGELGTSVNGLFYMNGSTDYLELYFVGTVTSGTLTLYGNSSMQAVFSASLVRAA